MIISTASQTSKRILRLSKYFIKTLQNSSSIETHSIHYFDDWIFRYFDSHLLFKCFLIHNLDQNENFFFKDEGSVVRKSFQSSKGSGKGKIKKYILIKLQLFNF